MLDLNKENEMNTEMAQFENNYDTVTPGLTTTTNDTENQNKARGSRSNSSDEEVGRNGSWKGVKPLIDHTSSDNVTATSMNFIES